MHIVVLDGSNPRSGTFVFPYTLEWSTGAIRNPALRCPALDWSVPGFLRIEPIGAKDIPQGAPPSPQEAWIPTVLVTAIFQVPDDQPIQMPPAKQVH